MELMSLKNIELLRASSIIKINCSFYCTVFKSGRKRGKASKAYLQILIWHRRVKMSYGKQLCQLINIKTVQRND